MIGGLLTAVRNRTFFSKLIVFTLVVSLLPILLISLFFYHNAKSSLKSELHRANSGYLSQTANAMEMVLSQTNNSIGQFLVDSAITDFELFPRGRYYELHNGPYSERELPFLEKYLSMKKKVLSNLENLQYANEFVYSVYYVDTSKGIVLEAAGSYLRSPENLEFEDAKRLLPANAAHFPHFMELRSGLRSDGGLVDILPVVYKTSASNNYIVVNLDAGKLYDKLVIEPESGRNHTFFVLSEEGRIILHADNKPGLKEAALLQGVHALAEEGGKTPVEVVDEGENRLITYKKSPLLGWTFVNAIALNDLYKGINALRNIVVTASLLLIIATGLLAFMVSRAIYVPLFRERNKMQEKLDESLPAYRDKFLGSLIRHNEYGAEEISKRMAFLGIECRQENLVLLLLHLEERRDRSQVADSLQQLINDRGAGFAVETGEQEIAVVVDGSGDELTKIFAFAEWLKNQLRLACGTVCTIGIGRCCENMSELNRAYTEAQEAVRSRAIGGDGQIIYIGDVRFHLQETVKQKGSRHIEEALKMIEDDGGAELTLSVAAERLNVSPSYLSRVFKEGTGENFSEYLTKVRMNRSKSLLLETDMLVKEIGERLGYTQSNYFIRLFREFTGMTPAEFRRNHANRTLDPTE